MRLPCRPTVPGHAGGGGEDGEDTPPRAKPHGSALGVGLCAAPPRSAPRRTACASLCVAPPAARRRQATQARAVHMLAHARARVLLLAHMRPPEQALSGGGRVHQTIGRPLLRVFVRRKLCDSRRDCGYSSSEIEIRDPRARQHARYVGVGVGSGYLDRTARRHRAPLCRGVMLGPAVQIAHSNRYWRIDGLKQGRTDLSRWPPSRFAVPRARAQAHPRRITWRPPAEPAALCKPTCTALVHR